MKKNEMSKTSELFFEYLSVCKELHVPAKEKYAYLDSKKEFESEDEKLAHLQEMIAFVKNTYHEIPMEQFLAEVNESQDWDGLKYYDDLYWDNIENLLTDAVRLSAVNVIKLVAPHILFGNELLLKEYCEKAPDDAAREALEQSFIRRHDEDYEKYPFSWVWNKREWNRKEDYGEIKLISLTDSAQENLWRAFLNEFALGSELLFYEHLTSRRVEGVKLDSERAGFRMRDLGYRITEDGFEKMPLPDYWIMKSVHHKPDDDMYYGAVCMEATMRMVNWELKQEAVFNQYGTTGYAYLEHVPDVKMHVSAEERALKTFCMAINGKTPWSDTVPLMSENCHYYSDGSGKDITGRGQIVAFLEELNRRINTPDLQCHAHYARLKKPECDPKLLEHKECERVLAIWQGELGEYYDCVVFFSINEEGLVDDICLRKDSRYIFRPFVPFEDDD